MERLNKILGGIMIGALVVGVFVLMGVMVSEFLEIARIAIETLPEEPF